MATVQLSLSDELQAFVEAQMAQGGHASAGEYLRALIREDQKRRAGRDLETKLMEGLRGPSTILTPEEWDSIERDARERMGSEQAGA